MLPLLKAYYCRFLRSHQTRKLRSKIMWKCWKSPLSQLSQKWSEKINQKTYQIIQPLTFLLTPRHTNLFEGIWAPSLLYSFTISSSFFFFYILHSTGSNSLQTERHQSRPWSTVSFAPSQNGRKETEGGWTWSFKYASGTEFYQLVSK